MAKPWATKQKFEMMSRPLRCPNCRGYRPTVSFNRLNLKGWCQICVDTEAEALREDDRVGRPSLYLPPNRRVSRLLATARVRARQRGWDFDLSRSWLAERLAKGRCEVTGLPFDDVSRDGRRDSFMPSIDRKNNAEGYTQSNCQLVVWIYNAAKGDGPASAVELMAKGLLGLLDQHDLADAFARRERPSVARALEVHVEGSLEKIESLLERGHVKK